MVHQVTNLEKCYLFSIFIREKNDKSDRLILNLKKFNQNVVYRHFEMDNLNSLTHSQEGLLYGWSRSSRSKLHRFSFQLEGQLCKYRCLPNGLTSAPTTFTKLLKPVLPALRKQSHQIMGYLDGTFLMGVIFTKCKETVVSSVELS